MEATISDLWKTSVCALCGAQEIISIDIFGEDAKSRKLIMKMETCLPLKINPEKLFPRMICYECLYNVENLYKFFNNVISTTIKFETLLNRSNLTVHLSKMRTDSDEMENILYNRSICKTSLSEQNNLINKGTMTDHLECNTCKTIFSIDNNKYNLELENKLRPMNKLVDYDIDSKSECEEEFNTILGEISDKIQNRKRPNNIDSIQSIFNSFGAKKPRRNVFVSTSRRKNKQPKKITNLEFLNNYQTNCLLCDFKFESHDLFMKHLYECHELEPKEIYNTTAPTNRQKDIPSLVRITDVLQNRNRHIKTNRDILPLSNVFESDDIEENRYENQLNLPIAPIIPYNVSIDMNTLTEGLWTERQYYTNNESYINNANNYICQICIRDFNDRSSLWLHLRATHPKHASLACGICLELMNSWNELQNHLHLEHNPNKLTVAEIRKYYCLICWRQNDIKKKLINHIYVHEFIIDSFKNSGVDFDPEQFIKINFIGSELDSDKNNFEDESVVSERNNSLAKNNHINGFNDVQLGIEDNIEQDIEEISYNGDEDMQESVNYNRSTNLNSMTEDNDVETYSVQKTPRNYTLTYGCEWCSRTLSSKWERWLHVASIHAPQNDVLRCSFPHCHKIFVTENFRNEHEQHHQIQGPVPNSCEVCCKLWNTRVDFYKHMMGVHPQAVPLVCGVCLKIFPTVPDLYNHVQDNHLPLQGDFVCNVCGRSYSNKSKMVRHRRIHGVNDAGIFLPNLTQNNQQQVISRRSKPIQDLQKSPLSTKDHTGISSPTFYNKALDSIGLRLSEDTPNQSFHGDSDSDNDQLYISTDYQPNLSNITCKECPDLRFSTFDDFSAHRRNVHQLFHCDLCTKSYGRNSHLWKHVNRCHKGNKLITCQTCFKTSASKYHLQQHINKIHSMKADRLKYNSSPQTLESFLDKKFDGYSFESVKQSFLRQELLEKEQMELNKLNKQTSDVDQRQPPKEIDVNSDLYTSIITNYNPRITIGPYKCLKCNKGFTKRYLLKKHKKNCRPRLQKDLLTRCKSCERIFKDRQSLQKHLANYHSEFKCHLCDIIFPSKCEIISHIRFTHGNHPDFVCECGQILRCTADLQAHRADHRNSHICQFCGDSLLSKMKLKMHVLSLHRKILSLSCGICLKLFATQYVLRDHVKLVHFRDTKFGNSCSVCGKKYGSKWKCFDHINKSHGKIFKPCKICLSVFETEEEVREHFCNVHLNGNQSQLQQIMPPKPNKIITNSEYVSDNNYEDDGRSDSYDAELLRIPSPNNQPLIPKITITSNKDNYSIVQKGSTPNSKPSQSTTPSSQAKRTVYENSDSPSMCEMCLKTWPAKKHLWQHYIRCHKFVAATICGICLKTHNSYLELRNHLHEKHPSLLHGRGYSSNFICKICGRYHNASSKLRLHMAIHVNYNLSDDYDYQEVKQEEKSNEEHDKKKEVNHSNNKTKQKINKKQNLNNDNDISEPFLGYNLQQRKNSENYLRNYLSLLDCFQIMKTLPPQNLRNDSDLEEEESEEEEDDDDDVNSASEAEDCDSEDERRKLLLKMSPISVRSTTEENPEIDDEKYYKKDDEMSDTDDKYDERNEYRYRNERYQESEDGKYDEKEYKNYDNKSDPNEIRSKSENEDNYSSDSEAYEDDEEMNENDAEENENSDDEVSARDKMRENYLLEENVNENVENYQKKQTNCKEIKRTNINKYFQYQVENHKSKNCYLQEVDKTQSNNDQENSLENEDNNYNENNQEEVQEIKEEIKEEDTVDQNQVANTRFEVDATNNCFILKYEDGRELRYEDIDMEYEIINEHEEDGITYEVYDEQSAEAGDSEEIVNENVLLEDDTESVNQLRYNSSENIASAIKSIDDSNCTDKGNNSSDGPVYMEEGNCEIEENTSQVILLEEEVVAEDVSEIEMAIESIL